MLYTSLQFIHLVSAILWLGGMGFMLIAFRPVLGASLTPPQGLPLLLGVLQRFFTLVWVCVLVLLGSGGLMFVLAHAQAAPLGWHIMAGVGTLMFLLFGHIHLALFCTMKSFVAAADWPAAGMHAEKIALLVKVNFCLGWLAIAAAVFLA